MKIPVLLIPFFLLGCASTQPLKSSEQEFVGHYKGHEARYPPLILLLELNPNRTYVLSNTNSQKSFNGEWKEQGGYIAVPAPGYPGWAFKIVRDGQAIALVDEQRSIRLEKVE